jgi:hypothetical protein
MICKIWIAVYVQPPLWQALHSYEIRLAVATGMPNSPGDSGTGTRRAESGGTTMCHRFSWKLQQHDAARQDEVGCGQRASLRHIEFVMVLNVSGQSAASSGPAWTSYRQARDSAEVASRGGRAY